MDALGEQVGESVIDQPLARDAVQSGESRAFDLHREMAFARPIIPQMAGVEVAVVGHDEMRRAERLRQAVGDDVSERGGGGGRHRAYIDRFSEGLGVADDEPRRERPKARFHGRVEANGRLCAEPGCDQPGEFRAPIGVGAGADGPGAYRWLCLDHVRAFNAGYNFFTGMSADEIHAAQRPYAGWERETRAFASSGADRPPKWSDFHDPLDAIGARFKEKMAEARGRADGKPLSGDDRRALKVLGLAPDADRHALRTRYSELVRKFHPDRNGGDRAHESALQAVVEAYQHLRRAPAFV